MILQNLANNFDKYSLKIKGRIDESLIATERRKCVLSSDFQYGETMRNFITGLKALSYLA